MAPWCLKFPVCETTTVIWKFWLYRALTSATESITWVLLTFSQPLRLPSWHRLLSSRLSSPFSIMLCPITLMGTHCHAGLPFWKVSGEMLSNVFEYFYCPARSIPFLLCSEFPSVSGPCLTGLGWNVSQSVCARYFPLLQSPRVHFLRMGEPQIIVLTLINHVKAKVLCLVLEKTLVCKSSRKMVQWMKYVCFLFVITKYAFPQHWHISGSQ